MELYKNEDQEIIEAKNEITELKAMKILIDNNDLACTIEISGLRMELCQNKWIEPVIDKQIKEIEKFIDRKENEWE